MKKLFWGLILACSFLMSPTSFAAVSPIAISIVPPVQFPPSDFDVAGLRLSALWGKQRAMSGIDIGLLGNITTQKFNGLAISGGFNYTEQDVTAIGLQAAGLVNANMQKVTVYGLQIAAINYQPAESLVGGLDLGLINWTPFTKINGFQVGAFNKARTVNGLQIGILNFTEDLHGIQIGLLNFYHNGLFVVSPIINAGF